MMRWIAVIVMVLAALALCVNGAGCAATNQDLPQAQTQAADEIGPQTVITNQGVMFLDAGVGVPVQKLADQFSFTYETATQTADGSQQGSTEQGQTATGGSPGEVRQEPKADVTADIKLPALPSGEVEVPDGGGGD